MISSQIISLSELPYTFLDFILPYVNMFPVCDVVYRSMDGRVSVQLMNPLLSEAQSFGPFLHLSLEVQFCSYEFT